MNPEKEKILNDYNTLMDFLKDMKEKECLTQLERVVTILTERRQETLKEQLETENAKEIGISHL